MSDESNGMFPAIALQTGRNVAVVVYLGIVQTEFFELFNELTSQVPLTLTAGTIVTVRVRRSVNFDVLDKAFDYVCLAEHLVGIFKKSHRSPSFSFRPRVLHDFFPFLLAGAYIKKAPKSSVPTTQKPEMIANAP